MSEPTLSFFEKVSVIQSEIKAIKDNFNSFGKYNYRKCEDILFALKPFLLEHKLFCILGDEIIMVGDRYYVRATAVISDGRDKITNYAVARESLEQKGMNDAQLTGSTSSYARKFALAGILGLDDEEDADDKDKKKITDTKKRIDDKNIKAENIDEINLNIGLIKNEMAVLCAGLGLQEKGNAMKDHLQINKFEELGNKTLEELKLKLKNLQAVNKEKKERQKQESQKTAGSNSFKV